MIKSENLKIEAISLCENFVEFWKEFKKEFEAIPADNTEEITSLWHKYFVNHNAEAFKFYNFNTAFSFVKHGYCLMQY